MEQHQPRLHPRPARPSNLIARAPRHRPPRPAAERHPPVFPTGRAWLVRIIGWEAAGCASQLAALLAEPEAAAALANSPAARRALAPILWMLGLTPPRPRRPRKPRPRAAPRQPATKEKLPPPRPSPPGWRLDPPPGPRDWWMPPKRKRPPPACGWEAIRKKGWAAARDPPP